MLSYETKYGIVNISNNFFSKLIGHAITSCYGVAGMVAKGHQKIFDMFNKNKLLDRGIVVKGNLNSITVDLHIVVLYGININAIANSIVHNIKYTVKEATGIDVKKVIIHVDGMREQ